MITGATEAEHLHNLQEVLSRLEQAGMRLKKDKCAFLLPQGHQISQKDLHPTKEKVGSTSSSECNSTKILSGDIELLQQIFAKSVNPVGSTLQFVAQKAVEYSSTEGF